MKGPKELRKVMESLQERRAGRGKGNAEAKKEQQRIRIAKDRAKRKAKKANFKHI